MATVAVREAGPGDVPVVRRIARTSWRAAHADIVGRELVEAFVDEYYAPERLREQVRQDGQVYLVATVDDAERPVGFAAAGPSEAPEADWSLYAIYVHPEWWGEGVGTHLLGRVERWVRGRGGRRVRLVVLQDNDRAVRFYERRGYDRVSDHWDDELGAAGWVYVTDL